MEIRNKVEESGLIQLDLASYKPSVNLIGIDLAAALWEGLVLREKDFRQWVKDHAWNAYSDQSAYIYCSADAIIPVWAYMLVSSELIKRGVPHVVGDKPELERQLIRDKIQQADFSHCREGRVIVKGCSDIPQPEFAMTELIKSLQPLVKSLMFGEPCSTVPIYKESRT